MCREPQSLNFYLTKPLDPDISIIEPDGDGCLMTLTTYEDADAQGVKEMLTMISQMVRGQNRNLNPTTYIVHSLTQTRDL